MRKRRLRAVTLIEIIVAAAVFSLAILVTFAAFNLAVKLTQYSKELSIASNIAQQKIETYRAAAFSSLTAPTTGAPIAVPQLNGGFMTVDTSIYDGNDKIIQITVKVYWANRPLNRAVTVSTIKTAGGISG